jgi:hypothetical protein
MNKGIWFVAGAAAGTLGTLLLTSERFRPVVTGLVGSVLTAQDSLLKRVEIFKEDLEDVVAEAKQRAAAMAQPQAAAKDGQPAKEGAPKAAGKKAKAAPGTASSHEPDGSPA